MKLLIYILPFFALASCGDDNVDEVVDSVSLETSKDSLSYSFGANEALNILDEQSPVYQSINKEELLTGFEQGIEAGAVQDQATACMTTARLFFNPQTGIVDTAYAKEGSKCYGVITAAYLYENLSNVNELGSVDMNLVIRGFEDALKGRDTIVTDSQKEACINAFGTRVSARLEAEKMAQSSALMEVEGAKWEEVKAIKGIKELEGGIYLETIKAGSGKLPDPDSDVAVNYVLYDWDGNMKQDSKQVNKGEPFTANVSGGLIQGWLTGFKSMRKGGTYKLYVPSNMAYGQGSLIFDIEFKDMGPKGTIHKPDPRRM